MAMKVMLASKWHEKNETMFPFWAQPKLDGIRCYIGHDGYAYSRSQKPIRNEEFQSMVRHHKDVLAGLDGELIVGDPTAENCYTRTMSAVMSYESDDIGDVKFHVFDIDNPFAPYSDRLDMLYVLIDKLPDFAEVVPTALMHDMLMLEQYEEEKLRQGHEGVILRNGDAYYKEGRATPTTGALIKRKKFNDMEGKIVAVYEEMENANEATINANGHTERSGHKANLVPKGRLGAVELEIIWKGEKKTVRCGSGFNAAQRDEYWQRRDELIGHYVKFKYFDVGCKDRPRFPIFLGFRDILDMNQGELI